MGNTIKEQEKETNDTIEAYLKSRREYYRAYYHKHKNDPKFIAQRKLSRKYDKQKAKARRRTYQLVYEFGKRLLKSRCSKCDSKENLEYHHIDYSDKDNVVILCRSCHGKERRDTP